MVTKTILAVLCDIISVTPMAFDENIFLSETSFSWMALFSFCVLFIEIHFFLPFLDYNTITQCEMNRLVDLNNYHCLCNNMKQIFE